MTSKRFRLQKILDLRRHSERETAVRAADEAERLAVAEDARDLVQKIRKSSADGISQVHNGVGGARSLIHLRTLLDAHVTHAETHLAEAKTNLEAVLLELKDRSIARRAIERLKEKRVELTRIQENRVEQRTLDDAVHISGLVTADTAKVGQ